MLHYIKFIWYKRLCNSHACIGNTSATPTTAAPVVIVKQVNEIHEDGSYTVGFEAADGTFKMETRDAEGNVVGKLGIKLTYQWNFSPDF